jgi:hypothetical protein
MPPCLIFHSTFLFRFDFRGKAKPMREPNRRPANSKRNRLTTRQTRMTGGAFKNEKTEFFDSV